MKRLFIFALAVATLTLVSCKKQYTVTVTSNNSAYGTVTGGGTYKKGTTATIAAIPANDCSFISWQDGTTTNPLSFEVTGDVAYVATFQQDASLADAFVGEYTLTGDATFNNVPMIGTYSMDLTPMDATIEKMGSSNEVVMTVAGQTTTGYVNSTGLHVDPVVVNQTIMTYTVAVTVTFPPISAPVNGTTSWTSTLNANISGIGITGTADMTATKK